MQVTKQMEQNLQTAKDAVTGGIQAAATTKTTGIQDPKDVDKLVKQVQELKPHNQVAAQ